MKQKSEVLLIKGRRVVHSTYYERTQVGNMLHSRITDPKTGQILGEGMLYETAINQVK